MKITGWPRLGAPVENRRLAAVAAPREADQHLGSGRIVASETKQLLVHSISVNLVQSDWTVMQSNSEAEP
jgi:hypothetical protein